MYFFDKVFNIAFDKVFDIVFHIVFYIDLINVFTNFTKTTTSNTRRFKL